MKSIVALSSLALVSLSSVSPCLAANRSVIRSSEQALTSQPSPNQPEAIEVAGLLDTVINGGIEIFQREQERQAQQEAREQAERERQAAIQRQQEELEAARQEEAEQQRLAAERQRQHFESLSPEEREAYLARQRAQQEAAAAQQEAGAAVLWNLVFGGESDASAAPQQEDPNEIRRRMEENQRPPEPEPAPQPSNRGGFYGNCHGGAAYGC